jgi:CRP-like cAMP-binding protein
MDEKLQDFIKKVSARIPDEDLPLLASCTRSRHLRKGEILLNIGDVCREFYLVNEGHLRTWYNKDGVTINLNFTFEGNFITNPQSIHGREPSELIIEAGEDTSLWVFNLDDVAVKYDRDPQIILFIRRLALHILLAAEEHSNFFKTHTPTERYRYIEKNNPLLLQRISLSQIASYLGVTRETLSRIRAKKS